MAMSHPRNAFVPPALEQRTKALGATDKLSKTLQRALTVAIEDSFPVIPAPKPGDWLSEHHEDGQTVNQFRKCQNSRPTPSQNIICIQPIGDFNSIRSPSLSIISEFSHLFFPGCRTEIVTPIDFDFQMKKRVNKYTKQTQYLTTNLEAHLKRMQRKRHNRQELFCVGVTMADIYPDPSWNFVYGEASPEDGIGLYSFARFDPLFPHSSPSTFEQPCTTEEQALILKRAVSTYVHEVMHLFGLEHCVYYLCLMNGTNCESEMDGSLLYLCPVCLRKMHLLFTDENYRIIDMYQGLLDLSKRVGFEEEAQWYANRLKIIQSN